MVPSSIAVLKPADIGATVEKPSIAFKATCGSAKSSGSATGILMVPSVEPNSSKLLGNGITLLEGSNKAVGLASPAVSGVTSSMESCSSVPVSVSQAARAKTANNVSKYLFIVIIIILLVLPGQLNTEDIDAGLILTIQR